MKKIYRLSCIKMLSFVLDGSLYFRTVTVNYSFANEGIADKVSDRHARAGYSVTKEEVYI